MFGYMGKGQAIAHGFTHDGNYYGIPLWMGALDSDAPMIATKWAPLEWLMGAFQHIEQTLRPLLFPHSDPAFMFRVGKSIQNETKGG